MRTAFPPSGKKLLIGAKVVYLPWWWEEENAIEGYVRASEKRSGKWWYEVVWKAETASYRTAELPPR